MVNQELAKIFRDIVRLLEIQGEKNQFRINSYRKAACVFENLAQDIALAYKENGVKGVREASGVGESIAKKVEEYLKSAQGGPASGGKGKIKYYEELKEETAIRQLVTYYFETKGLSLAELKNNAKKRKIIYSRYTKPAKQLLELAGSIEKAKEAISKVAEWANSRGLDYAIETVFKKWLELDRLKPKEIVKKPFYRGDPMVWSETKKKWYVVTPTNEWLEFADKEEKIEWRIVK